MYLTADLNDAGPRSEGASEVMGEHEMTKMVCPKLDFKAILGNTPGCSNTGVVDQHIDCASSGFEGLRRCPG